jgi:putative FmdB family regulatory protein
MPTYEYQCGECGHEFEAFQSITAGSLRKCPECGKLKLRRLIGTGGAVIFKGSGFWQTDYRSESYKSGAAKEKKASEGSSDKSKKSDSSSKSSSSDSSGKSESASKGDSTPKKSSGDAGRSSSKKKKSKE